MKNLLQILSNTELRKDDNTKKVLNKIVKNAFYKTSDINESETLVVLAYKYNLPCLDQLLNDLEYIPDLPF